MKTIIYAAVACFVSVVLTLYITAPTAKPELGVYSHQYYLEVIKACEGTLAVYQSRYGDL